MIQAKEITNWIQAQSPRFMDDLEALVNVDCGTSNKTGVETVEIKPGSDQGRRPPTEA
jgi:hypothetical protein